MESMEIMEIKESMESVVRTPGDAWNQSVPAPSGGDKIIEICYTCAPFRGGGLDRLVHSARADWTNLSKPPPRNGAQV